MTFTASPLSMLAAIWEGGVEIDALIVWMGYRNLNLPLSRGLLCVAEGK